MTVSEAPAATVPGEAVTLKPETPTASGALTAAIRIGDPEIVAEHPDSRRCRQSQDHAASGGPAGILAPGVPVAGSAH